jgi:hypothetical protein
LASELKRLLLSEELKDLDPVFRDHVVAAYRRRVKEMDYTFCKLALFLDPRFKRAINMDIIEVRREIFTEVCNTVKQLHCMHTSTFNVFIAQLFVFCVTHPA